MSSDLTKRIIFVCVPPIIELDLFGQLEVFNCGIMVQRANAPNGNPAYDIQVVSGGQGRQVDGGCGVPLQAHLHYTEVTGPVDTLIVVAGSSYMSCGLDSEFARWLNDNRDGSHGAEQTLSR